MKILIEGSPIFWEPRTGVGEYGRYLVEAMSKLDPQQTFDLFGFCFITKKASHPLVQPNLNYRLVRYLPGRVYNKLVEWSVAPPIDLLSFSRPDVTVFLNFIRYPLLTHSRSITIIHDLTFAIHPEFIQDDRFVNQLRQEVPRALTKSTHLVAVSENTKQDLARLYNAKLETITVIHPAVDHQEFKPSSTNEINAITKRYKIIKPYLLYLGTLEPRKNIAGLVRAFNQLPTAIRASHQLVLAGGRGWQFETVQAELDQATPGSIILTGFLDHKHKPPLYSGAKLFVYPSHYEGWGMQIPEAMACGAPVLAAANSSLPEAGGKAAAYIKNSKDITELSRSMARLLQSPAQLQRLRQAGFKQAAKFSWEDSAQRLLQLIYRTGKQ